VSIKILTMKAMNTNVKPFEPKTSIGGKAMEMSVNTSGPRQK
jgi:hypothetical protein